ncbi:MAG: hypothetical protein WBH47_07735 [Streptosporangiaceae bacterium]
MTEPAPRYFGTARILRPGDPVPPGAAITTDPARALADAWRVSATGATDRSPFVYEVAERDGALIVADDVLVSRQLARRAAELSSGGPRGA